MQAILFALMSYVGWGVGDIFGAIAARKIGGYQTTFWIMVGAALLFTPLAFLYWDTLLSAPILIIISALLVGFLYQSGNFAVSLALAQSDVSIVLTIMGSFGAFIVLFSTLFFHEPLSSLKFSIIATIFTGVFLCTYKPDARVDRKHMQGVWLSLYAAIAFGIFFTAIKLFTPTLRWFWPIYLSFLWIPVFYVLLKKRGITISPRALNDAGMPIVASLLLLRGGDFVFNVGLQRGLAAVVAPIGSASPTLSVLLAFLLFHEKPTRQQIIGIILALTGIVALGFTGNV